MVCAVVCLVLSLGIRYITMPNISKPTTNEYAAKTLSVLKEDSTTIIIQAFEKNITSEPSKQKPLTESHEHHKNQRVAETRETPAMDDVYVEITDPDVAREILLEIGRILAQNSRKANDAIRKVETTVDEYKEFTKSIQQ